MQNLIDQVKKEREDAQEKAKKQKIDAMLTLIDQAKEAQAKANERVKELEDKLERGDFAEVEQVYPTSGEQIYPKRLNGNSRLLDIVGEWVYL
jgi:wobble nucleotide-excising tRNase